MIQLGQRELSRNTCQCHTLLVYHFTIVLRIAEHSTARITEFNKRCKVILVSFFYFNDTQEC